MVIKTIMLSLLLFFVSFAQNSIVTKSNNVTVVRGDSTTFTLKYLGDLSGHPLNFVVKESIELTDDRLIQKYTGDGVSSVYSNPYTYISVTLQRQDTWDLENKTYHYDVYDSTLRFTPIIAKFTIEPDVQTPFDGTAPPTSGVRFYVAGTFIDSTVADSTLFRYDETTHSIVPITKEDVWQFLNVSDTVQTKIAEEMLNFKNYSLTFLYPTTNEDVLIDKTHRALTIDSIFCSTKDSSIAFNIYYASTRNGSKTGVFSSNQTITTATTLTSFANATIPAGRYLIFQFSTVAGLLGEEFYTKIYYRY